MQCCVNPAKNVSSRTASHAETVVPRTATPDPLVIDKGRRLKRMHRPLQGLPECLTVAYRSLSCVFSSVFILVLLSAGYAPQGYTDQADPTLEQLYDQLLNASNGSDAATIESEIWQVWLVAPDEESLELLKKISDSMSAGDFREALILCDQLVEEYPDYAEGWNKRATVYYLMSNFDASVADILETLQREPRHFGAISGLGLIFRHKNQLEEALGAFEQVLEISPQSLNAKRSVEQLRIDLEQKGI